MMKLFDTGKAGAFLNLYRVIGKDPVVKDIDGDADLYADRAYVLRALAYQRETEQEEYISIREMCRDAQEYINFLETKNHGNNHH